MHNQSNGVRFDRRSRSYRFKLWLLSNPNATPNEVRSVARKIGVSGYTYKWSDVAQTIQVLRDLGVQLPKQNARRGDAA